MKLVINNKSELNVDILTAEIHTSEYVILNIRDVRNGFFKLGSVLRKTAGSVRFWKTVGSVFFVDQL